VSEFRAVRGRTGRICDDAQSTPKEPEAFVIVTISTLDPSYDDSTKTSGRKNIHSG
jgi:hypothetical protein